MALTKEQIEKLQGHARDNPMPGTTSRPTVAGQPLHVDGDYLAYYCAGSDDTSQGTARENVLDRLSRAAQVSGSDRIIVHLSDPRCTKGYRFLVADSGIPYSKGYQAQRGGTKPKNWDYLRGYLETYEGGAFEVRNWIDREADDAMAYLSEAAYTIKRPGAVYTADKDMRMFAGLHIVWKTFQMVEILPGTYDKVFADKQYGHKFFWMQMVMGDPADNIPGLPRCGEVAAANILEGTTGNEQAMERVLELYRTKVGEHYADFFVEQAILLWMRTDKSAELLDFLTMPATPERTRQVIWPADVLRASKRVFNRVREEADALAT